MSVVVRAPTRLRRGLGLAARSRTRSSESFTARILKHGDLGTPALRIGGDMAPSSFEIGKVHETRLRDLLNAWGISYVSKKKVTTDHGRILELDFWLPPTNTRAGIVVECKNFGVAAQHVADSRRRKEQEALWLLIQIRRYCA